jgi:hypothetical protein
MRPGLVDAEIPVAGLHVEQLAFLRPSHLRQRIVVRRPDMADRQAGENPKWLWSVRLRREVIDDQLGESVALARRLVQRILSNRGEIVLGFDIEPQFLGNVGKQRSPVWVASAAGKSRADECTGRAQFKAFGPSLDEGFRFHGLWIAAPAFDGTLA